MPLPFFNAHVRALPHLQADEMLDAAAVVAHGANTLTKESRDGLTRLWQSQASESRTMRPQSKADYRLALAAAGVALSD